MNTLVRRAAAAASCATALSAVAAPAGAAWSPPQQLPGTAGRFPAFAAYGPGGAASVGVYGPLALFPGNPQAPIALSTAATAQTFGAPVALRDGLAAPIAVSSNGTMLAVGGPRSPLDYFTLEGRRARLRVGIGPVGGVLKRVATPAIVGTRTLASAVNDSGDAAIVFSRCVDKSCRTRAVLATFRRRGRDFGAPVVLAHRTGYPVAAVALNARGDALVAWIQHRATGRGNDVRARMRRADGTLTKMRLAGPTAPVPTIAVTLTRARRGIVAWFSEGVSEGSGGGPYTVSAVGMDSGGRLGASYQPDHGNPTGHGDADAIKGARLRTTVGADGVTTLAWTGFAGGHYVVRSARIDRQLERDQLLSPPTVDAQLMDLATDGAGDVLALWASVLGTATTPVVAAHVRPAGATTFGPAQVVLTGADVSGTAAGAIAPGRAIVAGGQPEQINGTGAVRVTQLIGGA